MYSELLHFIKYFKSPKWTDFSVFAFDQWIYDIGVGKMFSLCSRFSVEYSVMNTMRWNYKPIVTSSMPPQVVFFGSASLAVRFIYVACSYVALTTPFCNFRHNTDLWQQLNLWNTTIIINGAKRFPVLRWVFGQLGLKQQQQKRFQVVRDHASYIYFKLAWQKKT